MLMLICEECNNQQIISTNPTARILIQRYKLSCTEDFSWNGDEIFLEILIKTYFFKRGILNKIFKIMFLYCEVGKKMSRFTFWIFS